MPAIDLTSDESVENGVRLTRGARRMLRDLMEIRVNRGLSKVEVADAIGIDRSGITRFEAQENQPRLDTVLRYAHTVGATVTFIVEPVEEWNERHAVVPSRLVKRRPFWRQSDEDESSSAVREDTLWTERVVRPRLVRR